VEVIALGVHGKVLGGGLQGSLCDEKAGLPHAGHSQLQRTHCRAQLSPPAKMVAPQGKHVRENVRARSADTQVREEGGAAGAEAEIPLEGTVVEQGIPLQPVERPRWRSS